MCDRSWQASQSKKKREYDPQAKAARIQNLPTATQILAFLNDELLSKTETVWNIYTTENNLSSEHIWIIYSVLRSFVCWLLVSRFIRNAASVQLLNLRKYWIQRTVRNFFSVSSQNKSCLRSGCIRLFVKKMVRKSKSSQTFSRLYCIKNLKKW